MTPTFDRNRKTLAFLTFCCFPLLCGGASAGPPSKPAPVAPVTPATEGVVYTWWGKSPTGNPRKVTIPSGGGSFGGGSFGGGSFWVPRHKIKTVADLERAAKLIVVVRVLDDITERLQLLLYHEDGDVYPDLGYSVAQVKVLKVIKKPARFRLPSSGTIPICEPSFVYPHPHAGPDGLVLRPMMGEYQEIKKGETYLLFLGEEPKDDIKRNAGLMYGVVEAHMGKYNLSGGDTQDDVADADRADMLRDGFPAALVVQHSEWKKVLLRRYAARLR